jgi:hypothetical protein
MTQDTYALTEHAAGFLARRIWAAEVEDLPEPLREVLRRAVAELVHSSYVPARVAFRACRWEGASGFVSRHSARLHAPSACSSAWVRRRRFAGCTAMTSAGR